MNKIIGTAFSDMLVGTEEADLIKGKGAPDYLRGMEGDDVLKGGKGWDGLDGGPGQDTLIGGKGGDYFIFRDFDTFDKVKDFGRGNDKLVIVREDSSVGHSTEDLQFAPRFHDWKFKEGGKGSAAKDKASVMYNEKSGKLWYDADGKNGPEDPVLIAKLGKGTDVDAGDIIIVG